MTKLPKSLQRIYLAAVWGTIYTVGIFPPSGGNILQTVNNVNVKTRSTLNDSNISMVRVRRFRRLRLPYRPMDFGCNSIINPRDVISEVL